MYVLRVCRNSSFVDPESIVISVLLDTVLHGFPQTAWSPVLSGGRCKQMRCKNSSNSIILLVDLTSCACMTAAVIFNLKPQPGKPLRWELLTGTSSRIGLPPEITTRRQDACSRGTRLICCSPTSGRTPRSLITMSYLHRREWSTKTSTRLRVRDV
jgi:hypothetical protein